MIVGLQLCLRELRLLSGRYNYVVRPAQACSFVSAAIGIALVAIVVTSVISGETIGAIILKLLLALLLLVVEEWLLAKRRPRTIWQSWIPRAIIILIYACACARPTALLVAFLAGVYLRNSPFGAAHIKPLCLEHSLRKRPNVAPIIALKAIGDDQTEIIQRALDELGQSGGGTLRLSPGTFHINLRAEQFLQINYSNVALEGSVDDQGRLLTTLVSHQPTVRGHKHPWLSPFAITAGEQLQASNEFWGVDFRKKRQSFTRSNSLSDPGSDGTILTPPFATHVTADALRGERLLTVDDSSRVGRYVLLVLYNTSPDGNLIKELLGMDTLRDEWTIANRAGKEEAPSYQWLVEVSRVIDAHTIEIAEPLLRDCPLLYTPALFNVAMLERVAIRNLHLSSTWNGQFRHHGFPLYYSVSQAQEMDYGWNAINLKRVAHGEIRNVVISNFSNPLYLVDAYHNSVSDLHIEGYDGHQGIKLYMHSCHNTIERVVFTNHYADMLVCEGNAYGNLFADISYANPEFNPVDYDFHGFGEGPFAPPSDNLFTQIRGFRYVKHAGSVTHLPSAALNNAWVATISEGERRGDHFFYNMTYRPKHGLTRWVYALGYAAAMVQKTRALSPKNFIANVKEKLRAIDYMSLERSAHGQVIPQSRVEDLTTTCRIQSDISQTQS